MMYQLDTRGGRTFYRGYEVEVLSQDGEVVGYRSWIGRQISVERSTVLALMTVINGLEHDAAWALEIEGRNL
jgi:hypothetical protein